MARPVHCLRCISTVSLVELAAYIYRNFARDADGFSLGTGSENGVLASTKNETCCYYIDEVQKYVSYHVDINL